MRPRHKEPPRARRCPVKGVIAVPIGGMTVPVEVNRFSNVHVANSEVRAPRHASRRPPSLPHLRLLARRSSRWAAA